MLEMNDDANKVITDAMNDADRAIAAFRKRRTVMNLMIWSLFAVATVLLCVVVVRLFVVGGC